MIISVGLCAPRSEHVSSAHACSFSPNRAVALFGGPYSNLEATRAVLAEAERRQIPPERIVCTGDVVAYAADAKATVDLVRESGIRVVMGNCEEALSVGAADCGCGFAPGSDCERLSAAWFAHADRQLDADARAWMASLPRRLDVELAGLTLAVVHGSLTEINRFVFASTPDRVKALDLASRELTASSPAIAACRSLK